jgi:hypothetical protein
MGLLRVGLCQLFHCDRESQYLLSTRRSPRTFLQIRLAMAWARRDQTTLRQNLASAECRGFFFCPNFCVKMRRSRIAVSASTSTL